SYSDLGDAVQAMFYAERALALAPDRPENLAVVAELRQASGDGVGSLEAYDRLVQIRPGDAAAHVARARLLHSLEQRASAVEAYRTAARLAPDNPEILGEAMALELELGNLHEALAGAERLATLNASPETELFRAEVLVRLDQIPEAVEAFQQVLAMAPSNREAREALESLAPGLLEPAGGGSTDPVELAASLAEQAEDDLRNTELRVDAINANLAVADLATASTLADDGLLFFPGSRSVVLAAVETHLNALRLEEAETILESASEISEEADWAEIIQSRHEFLGWLRTGEDSQSTREAARRYAEAATEEHFRTPLQWLILGDLRSDSGDRAGAVTAWRNALAGAPESTVLLSRLR
ncbi:MAG: hypothetical protein KJO44_10360, partial [Gemmatimonadetes bacterium]|nr:hypothetical protein [Gemmatimonadota bacterium]